MKDGKAEKQGGRGKAESPRPVWVDETDAAEMPNFEPSPRLFSCACAFIWGEARQAYESGDNALLARAGFADALQFIADPTNAGTDAAAYSEMLTEWKQAARRNNELVAKRKKRAQTEMQKKVARFIFWGYFDESKKPSESDLTLRRLLLTQYPGLGTRAGVLRMIRETYENAKSESDLKLYDTLTDKVIYATLNEDETDRARVRAYWLNSCFSLAGEALAEWLNIAALPDYAETLAELRKLIADNYGIFPAPFTEDRAGTHSFVNLAGDELRKLIYISRAQTRAAESAQGGEPATGAESGAAKVSVLKIDAGKVEMQTPQASITAGNVETPAPKEKPAGRANGISQADFAALLKHYGGRFDGEPYKVRAIKEWDANPKKRPMAGGVVYSPGLRNDPIAARKWAMDFNAESQRRWNARKSGLRFY